MPSITHVGYPTIWFRKVKLDINELILYQLALPNKIISKKLSVIKKVTTLITKRVIITTIITTIWNEFDWMIKKRNNFIQNLKQI